VSDEFAVRFPNVVFGDPDAGVIFALWRSFSGGSRIVSALLWSAGTIAIIDNRLAKEDTSSCSLPGLGTTSTFGEESKRNQCSTVREAYGKWYVAAGASFGLMLASKYFPTLFGSNSSITICHRTERISTAMQARFFAPARHLRPGVPDRHPVILFPGTIKYSSITSVRA